jgi:predicted small secreted protein
MKRYTLWITLLATFALSGCNTFAGLGKDLSQTGQAVENSADWSQKKINEANDNMHN